MRSGPDQLLKHLKPPPRSLPVLQNVDLMRLPVAGSFLAYRHARTLLQIPFLLLAIVMVLHGFFGPQLAPKNLATMLGWVHFRGALVAALLLAGNLFCLACPLVMVRDLTRRFIKQIFNWQIFNWQIFNWPRLNWPRRLRNKWLSLGLFVLVLFAYELADLWSSPFWTASLIAGYFLGILIIDSLFKHASFCKFVCPIGQFNFAASTISPLEIRVRDLDTCAECRTKDCIRGRVDDSKGGIAQRGCELALFQPRKTGNMDCTFCLDCIHACPHDNVGIIGRVPASELIIDPLRSGIGRFSRRRDLAALAIFFTFGALLNAFGMVSPVYALESWLSNLLSIESEAPVLGLIFFIALVVEPVLLLGATAFAARRLAGSREALLSLVTRYSYGLIPLGFGIWLAHYGFHLLTGLLTFIPVAQSVPASFGWPTLGEPRWELGGVPERFVYPLELGLIGLGLLGSLLVFYRLAEEDRPERAGKVFAPWAALCLLLWAAAMWLLSQPMEMRGTFFGG